jgi:hypothetical protein
MGVIDDIASRLDPTDLEAAQTDALSQPPRLIEFADVWMGPWSTRS